MSAESAAASASEPWTVRRVLSWMMQHFTERGCDTPRLDAEILLAHILDCPRIQLYVQYERPLTDYERARLRELVKRRSSYEPVAYLVGHREFFGLKFRVTPEVLIPRPDTETLVLELIDQLKGISPTETCNFPSPVLIELGIGSGAISVAAAAHLPSLTIHAVDISPAALEVARENASRHEVGDRVMLYEGDLFSPLPSDLKVEAIVSNPPYVRQTDLERLDADVRDHEPRLALDGGIDGLDVARRILSESSRFLKPGGLILLELSPDNIRQAEEFLESQGVYENIRILKDAGGRERVLAARKV
jgi:release factor glutamine methyltransferase